MHNKDKVILDKKLPYEYSICLYVLEKLCDKGIIDVFEMTETIILQSGYQGNNFLGKSNPSIILKDPRTTLATSYSLPRN